MEKPVLFNSEMVNAILENRKTVTRRIIKDVNDLDFIGVGIEPKKIENTAAFGHGNFEDIVNAKIVKHVKAPCLQGDILYVRETWWRGDILNSNEDIDESNVILYCADERKENLDYETIKWKPSIHMPKKLARIFLKVKDVRIERLHQMTTQDILKEGVYNEVFENYFGEAKNKLMFEVWENLWNRTIKKEQSKEYGWNANPWVWVIEFESMDKSEVEKNE